MSLDLTQESVAGPLAPNGAFPVWAQRIFVANLVAQIAIVVTGGVVRLTGSGLGCPTWPECVPGSFVPVERQEQAWHKYVEFGNRSLTFILGLLALAALAAGVSHVVTSRRSRRVVRRTVVALACLPLLGTLGQAVLGGITVLTGLSPATVAAHLLVSLAIVAGCVVLVERAREPGDRPMVVVVRPELRIAAWLLVVVAALVVILGTIVTGSGPHSGDAKTPRFDLDPRTISWLHADVVLLYLGLLAAIALALRLTDAPRAPRRAVVIALIVALSQGLIGYVQYLVRVWYGPASYMCCLPPARAVSNLPASSKNYSGSNGSIATARNKMAR